MCRWCWGERDAQRCPGGLDRALRLLPLEVLPLSIEVQLASTTEPKASLRTWESRSKTSSSQHVFSCPAPGPVWGRTALLSPFSGSCDRLICHQTPQEAMLLLVTHPKVSPSGLSWTLPFHVSSPHLVVPSALCRVSCCFNVLCII